MSITIYNEINQTKQLVDNLSVSNITSSVINIATSDVCTVGVVFRADNDESYNYLFAIYDIYGFKEAAVSVISVSKEVTKEGGIIAPTEVHIDTLEYQDLKNIDPYLAGVNNLTDLVKAAGEYAKTQEDDIPYLPEPIYISNVYDYLVYLVSGYPYLVSVRKSDGSAKLVYDGNDTCDSGLRINPISTVIDYINNTGDTYITNKEYSVLYHINSIKHNHMNTARYSFIRPDIEPLSCDSI